MDRWKIAFAAESWNAWWFNCKECNKNYLECDNFFSNVIAESFEYLKNNNRLEGLLPKFLMRGIGHRSAY